MKNLIIVLLIIFVISDLNAKKLDINGSIKTSDTTIIDVVLSIPISFNNKIDLEGLQKNIRYYDSNKKIIKGSPEFINEVRFNYNGEEIELIGLKNNIGDVMAPKYCFFQIVKKGKLKKYKYYQGRNTNMYGPANYSAGIRIETVDVLQVDDGELFVPAWFNNFNFYMKKYLKDCQKVTYEIDQKNYTIDDLDTIIDEYNTCK